MITESVFICVNNIVNTDVFNKYINKKKMFKKR